MSLIKMVSAFVSLLLLACPVFGQTIVNLTHLDYLNKKIARNGETILLTYIYCEYPDYKLVDAVGEGISCVDDVARAAIVYLKDFQYTKNKKSLQKARWALNFVMQMQAHDGEFYNFVYKNLAINKKGRTSYKSVGFWAARGLWALSEGYSIFRTQDPQYATRLQKHIKKSISAIEKFISLHPQKIYSGFTTIPQWLVPVGADCWSIFLLGLTKYYQLHPSDEVKALIVEIADAISGYQYGDFRKFPFGAHLSWGGNPNLWHGWGNRQCQALVLAYQALGNKKWLLSAQREASCFYTYLLTTHMLGQINPAPKLYEQIAYTVSPIVEGFLELAKATGDDNWAKLAGVTASWFLGNNPHGVAIYDPKTGRCFDGLRSSNSFNRNSGAESTIEALLALSGVENHSVAKKYLYFRPISSRSVQILKVRNNKATFFLNTPGEYLCYFHFQKTPKTTLVIDNHSYSPATFNDYPLVQDYPDVLSLGSGEHTFSFAPDTVKTIILQPTLTSKTFIYKDHYMVLSRDSQKLQVTLYENEKLYVLKDNFEWSK